MCIKNENYFDAQISNETVKCWPSYLHETFVFLELSGFLELPQVLLGMQ